MSNQRRLSGRLINRQFQIRYSLLLSLAIVNVALFFSLIAIEFSLYLLIPLAVISFLLSVYLTHKIAGPMQRIILDLDTLSTGDYSKRVLLRRNDELQDIAAAINTVTKSAVIEIQKDRKLRDGIVEELDRLADSGAVSEEGRAKIGLIREDVLKLTEGFRI